MRVKLVVVLQYANGEDVGMYLRVDHVWSSHLVCPLQRWRPLSPRDELERGTAAGVKPHEIHTFKDKKNLCLVFTLGYS